MNGHLFEVERLVRHRHDDIAREMARVHGVDLPAWHPLRARLAMMLRRRGKGAATVAGSPVVAPSLQAGIGD